MQPPSTIDAPLGRILPFVTLLRRSIGGGLYFWFMKDAVRDVLDRGGYLGAIGEDNIFAPKDDVMGEIYKRLDSAICRMSTARIFAQCHVALPNGEPRPAMPIVALSAAAPRARHDDES